MPSFIERAFRGLVLLSTLCGGLSVAQDYDPLFVIKDDSETLLLDIHDEQRNRAIPIRVYLPKEKAKAPVVLFSHGLGGSRDNNRYLGQHWSKRGYVAVFMQHPGSDESVWRGQPPRQVMGAMRDAASAKNLLLRCQDVRTVIDSLTKWHNDANHQLAGRMDLDHIGMSGHSFGAYTTQAVSGQNFPLIGQRHTDKRIQASIAFSPSAPMREQATGAFTQVSVPWLLMTGTKDSSPIGDQTEESRLKVFPALPASVDHYELVLENGEHSAFSERALPGDRAERNPNHHRVILAISTAFWDTYLKGDTQARAWLQGDGPKKVAEEKDRWQIAVANKNP